MEIVTDLAAFLSGTTSQLPALRDFCIYAAAGVLFDFSKFLVMFLE